MSSLKHGEITVPASHQDASLSIRTPLVPLLTAQDEHRPQVISVEAHTGWGIERTRTDSRYSCIVFHRAPVQSPTTRMWTLTYGSPGALVMVNGCHSVVATAGTLTKVYWPGLCGRREPMLAGYGVGQR